MTLKVPKDKKEIEELLENAARCLFANQPNIYCFTSESGKTEWNLAHHYANEISKFLRGYDCDLEITKVNYSRRRPDIIFHERGTNDNNFLVIEVKRDGRPSDISKDIQKIEEYWFQGCLNYKFGASVNLNSDKSRKVKVLENQGRR